MVKTERFQFVLSSDEKTVIELLAELEGGLSQAALIRRLIHRAAVANGIIANFPSQGKAVPFRVPEDIHKTKELDL